MTLRIEEGDLKPEGTDKKETIVLHKAEIPISLEENFLVLLAQYKSFFYRLIPSLSDDNNENLGEHELAGVEIDLINKIVVLYQNQQNDELQNLITVHPEINKDNLIEEIKFHSPQKLREEIIEDQKEMLRHFAILNSNFSTPILKLTHRKQEKIGQNGKFTCVLASLLNAFDALDFDHNYTEEKLEKEITEANNNLEIYDKGGIKMGYIEHFLNDKKFSFSESLNIIELINCLNNNGVAILARQSGSLGHAVLISGAFVENGQVWFRINDPLGTGILTEEPAEFILNSLNFVDAFANLFLIKAL